MAEGQRTARNHRQSGSGESLPGEQARRRLLAKIPATERVLILAGIATSVLEGGVGPPVVLLHGPMGNATHWMQVIPGLVTTHRVIVPDLPGHGASEVLDSNRIDSSRVMKWLGELIAQACDEPPVLVGQTLGGAIAARFASKQGRSLKALVLVDTLGLRPFEPAPEFGRAMSRYLAQPTEQTHTDLWQHCAFDLDALRRRMDKRWQLFEAYNLDRARDPGVQAATASLMEQFAVPAISGNDLASIEVPTTLIWGRHDCATPLSVAENASARFGWPMHVIENCNDDPPVEQPEELLRKLRVALA